MEGLRGLGQKLADPKPQLTQAMSVAVPSTSPEQQDRHVACFDPSGTLMWALFLPAALPSVPEILNECEDEFFQVVYPKYNLLKLVRKKVITKTIADSISATNDDEGKEILYHHLKHHGSVHSLREFCEAAMAADGYPNMQKLAEKILQRLSQGGWLHELVHMCRERMYVLV